MGIFDFLKGTSNSKSNEIDKRHLSAENSSTSKEESEIRDLKRRATTVKNEDINKAIQLMQQVVELEKGEEVIASGIRLAKYLFKANRGEEAWKLYNELIVKTADIKDKFIRYLKLMNIYQAMGQQLEQEGKYKPALRNYLIAAFLQKKADLQYFIEWKKENSKMISMGASNPKEAEESIEKEKNNYYERVQFLSSDFHPFIKKNKYPQEKQICSKILGKYGGWSKFLDNLGKINLSAFSSTISNSIELFG